MSTTTFVRLVGVSIILVSSLVMTESQRTATSTETTTIISTVFVTRNFLCAKLVNVTGACRRSRGFLIDEPVVLTFDEELNEPVDKTLDSVLHPQFKPSATLGVEVTPLVLLPAANVNGQHTSLSAEKDVVVQPSKSNNIRTARNHDPQIYISHINAFFSNIVIVNNQTPRSSVTVTVTQSVTKTISITTGTTISFFLMYCTPHPFPFVTCTTGISACSYFRKMAPLAKQFISRCVMLGQ